MTNPNPNISRVVREALQSCAGSNRLRVTFAVDSYRLSHMIGAEENRYIDFMKKCMYQDMASHLEKHSDVTVEHRKESILGIDEHVYRAETFVFTKQELIDLLQAVETATYDALHPMAKWGQGD